MIQTIFHSLLEIHRDPVFTYNAVKSGIGFVRYWIQRISAAYIPIIGKATVHIMKVKFQEET